MKTKREQAMQYKFIENTNFEDLSCGRVLYHKTGFPNYPVRLACEIFMRCLEILAQPEKVCLYDPCCGGGYLLTVLGFLYNDRIDTIYASDISGDAVHLAESNLSLLSTEGLCRRKEQLEAIYAAYGKDSHRQAIKSVDTLFELIRGNINCNLFQRDVLDISDTTAAIPFADIILTDVPYGKLVSWSKDEPFPIDSMLDSLWNDLKENAVVAVSSDKRQKINHPNYRRIEKFQAGKRKIEILRKSW